VIKLIDLLTEARYQDIEVVPTTGPQRGVGETDGKSYAIIIGNPGVYRKMETTPMGKPGKMKALNYGGAGSEAYREFEWDADTTQWDVWQRMNYVVVTPRNETHWYHGKMPGGGYKDFEGATGTPLPDLKIDRFGYKVYKALLGEPSVGYIISDKTSSPEIKGAVYSKLMQDNELVWIATNGNTTSTYDNIVMINPDYADVQKVRQRFEAEHKGDKFFYSRNFPK
jgi:hypothetical protein